MSLEHGGVITLFGDHQYQPAPLNRVDGILHIATPVVAPNQRLQVHLDITFPVEGAAIPTTRLIPIKENDDFDTMKSVTAAVEMMSAVAASHVVEARQPL